MAEGTDGPESLVLRYLRSIDMRLERVERKLRDHDHEFAHIRTEFAAMRTDSARQFGQRLELEQRVERIERRLDLVDEASST